MTLAIGLPGAEIVEAGRPADGLRCVRERMPDAVVVDRFFPDADGLEMVRALRANPATRHLPVVMVSAAYDDDREQIEAAGVDAYLGKPFDPDELFAVVRDLIARAPARQAPPPPGATRPRPRPRRREPLRAATSSSADASPAPIDDPAEPRVEEQLAATLAANARLVHHVELLEAELEELRARQPGDDDDARSDAVARLRDELAIAEETIDALREQLAAARLAADEVDQLRRELAIVHADIELLEGRNEADGPPKATRRQRPTKP